MFIIYCSVKNRDINTDFTEVGKIQFHLIFLYAENRAPKNGN